jgi:hypothetical protein
VVQPQAVGFLHLSAVYLITWFAAFMGTVLGGVYVGESALYTDVPGVNKNKDYLYVSRRGKGPRRRGRAAGRGGGLVGCLGWATIEQLAPDSHALLLSVGGV